MLLLPGQCPSCEAKVRPSGLSKHYYHSPLCNPNAPVAPAPVVPAVLNTVHDLVSDHLAADGLRHTIAWDLANLRSDRYLDAPTVHELKKCVNKWVLQHVDDAYVRCEELLLPGVSALDFTERIGTKLFAGIATEKTERAFAVRNMPYLAPRILEYPGAGKAANRTVASFDVFDLVVRRMTHDKWYRETIMASSDEWKTGDRYRVGPTEIKDVMDGVVARFHQWAHKKATKDEIDEIRIGLILNADDVQVPTPRAPPHCMAATHTHTHCFLF